MVQALNITVDSAFDATLPVALHPLGVPGYANRYVADTLSEAAGATIVSWADKIGTAPLVVNTAAPPVIGTEAGFKYVSTDGTSSGLRASFSPAGSIKSIVGVIRTKSATLTNNNWMFAGGVNLVRNNDNSMSMFASGSTANAKTAAGTAPSDKWMIVIYTIDGVNSTVQVNNNLQTSNSAGPITGLVYQYGIGREATTYGKNDYAEIVGYPQILTPTERATILTNLQARYAALLAL